MSQRHATDAVSLVFGTVFAGFTLVWLVALADDFQHRLAWWAGPMVLVVAGVAGLVASLRPRRTSDGEPRDAEPVLTPGAPGPDTAPDPAPTDPA